VDLKIVGDLLDQMERARLHAAEDPFGNPVLAVALAIGRRIDEGELTLDGIDALIHYMRDQAYADRAVRLAAYVGGTGEGANLAAIEELASRLVRPDPDDSPIPWAQFRRQLERTRFAAVFTAHPTFAHPPALYEDLAGRASGREGAPSFPTHRPRAPTLEDEFAQAVRAMQFGRDALDRLSEKLLAAAQSHWPDRWVDLVPRPVILTSWVGYDTDGRTDIGWWDTLRLRLRMKRLQLERLAGQLGEIEAAAPILAKVAEALHAVSAQVDACPTGPDIDVIENFAHLLVDHREAAMVSLDPLLELFAASVRQASAPDRMKLAVARAGLVAHVLSLTHTHVRLNAAQLHNATRLKLGFSDPPADPSRRRVLLGMINVALDTVEPAPVDFGALLLEQASAPKLMMTVAQIVKHIDGTAPVRFLIAETESGYTLLAALYLARLFGVDRHIEISPLFETPEALEQGGRVIEEALRSPHYRAYLRATGRLAVQFGYSDSGRYVGQLPASYLIERLRLKLAEAMTRHGLGDIELILFDTHGESIGRGAHPGSLLDRLKYLAPATARQALARAGIAVREESAFQGGDGYLLFGTPELALATIARIAKHAFASVPAKSDPIYSEPDFAADFFTTAGLGMQGLVEDPGYASLLGAFGPALLDKTGSRPAARQSEGMGTSVAIRHPRELRAIPNNAILQQLGWCANSLQGLGEAAARQPELFVEIQGKSPRFRRALDFAGHALAHSDLAVLRAVVALLDPGSWLDRAGHATRPGRAQALASVARILEQLDLWRAAQAMVRRIQADHVALRNVWVNAPTMSTREMLLHALRVALIQRIWLLATAIPDFSPRHGVTRSLLLRHILQLEIPASLKLLTEIFPNQPDPALDRDFAEPKGPRGSVSYAVEYETIFLPMKRMFDLVRELGTAVTHEVGAFG